MRRTEASTVAAQGSEGWTGADHLVVSTNMVYRLKTVAASVS